MRPESVEVIIEVAGHMNVNGENRVGAFISFPEGQLSSLSWMVVWQGERLRLYRDPTIGMEEYGPYVPPDSTTGREG